MQEYIKAGVVQPFADPGVSDAGNPSWKSDFLPVTLKGVTFGGKVYGMPFEGTQPVFFVYNKTGVQEVRAQFPGHMAGVAERRQDL